jgi:hypothetical protein
MAADSWKWQTVISELTSIFCQESFSKSLHRTVESEQRAEVLMNRRNKIQYLGYLALTESAK